MMKAAVFLLENLHVKIFGSKMSSAMRSFLGHLSWSFLGMAFSSLVLFLINVVAGRIMGPEEYGRYNLVLTIAYVVSVLMVFGQDMACIKYIASSGTEKEKRGHFSNSLWVVSVSILVVSILAFLFAAPAASLLGTTKILFAWAILYAAIFSARSILDSLFRALIEFKLQALVKILEGIVILGIFVGLFFLLQKQGYQSYVFSLTVGFLFFCILFFYRNKFALKSFDKKLFAKTWDYTRKTILLAVVTILAASIDKLFVGKFLGVKELGVYSAYLTASILLVSQSAVIFGNAFFPMINKIEETKKPAIVEKVDRLGLLFFAPGVLGIFVASFLLFKMFGREYELNLAYLLIFSSSSFFQLVASFYKNIAMSSVEKYRYFLNYSIFSLVLFAAMLVAVVFMQNSNLLNVVLAYFLYNFCYLLFTRASCRK